MSRIRDDRRMRSDSLTSLNRSTIGRSQQAFTTKTNYDVPNRHGESKDQTSTTRYSERRSNSNEHAQNSSTHNPHTETNNDRRIYAKRGFETFHPTSEAPPIKRPRLPPVSYLTLTGLSNKSSEEVLDEMVHPNFQLKKFLNDKRMKARYDWISSMTILLEKITLCNESRERISAILEQLPDTLYLEGVYDEVRNFDPDTNELRFEFIRLFLKISNTFLAMMPQSADGLTKIFERIELLFTKTETESNEFEETRTILCEVLEQVKEIEKRRQLQNPKLFKTTNGLTTNEHDVSQSSSHYRQLPIIPDVIEILSEQRTPIRKNIVDGIYENAEQYLDIHFRLLREDFIAPLRDGIRQYLAKIKTKNLNIRIYENVRLIKSRITPRNGFIYDLLLDRRIASKIFWANSRRIMYGNLLLLSSDNFQSCAFCTVEDRSEIAKTLTFSVKALERSNNYEQTQINLDKMDFSSSFTMIETMTYFEAYRPVLNALQIIPSDHQFPLAPFLLKLTNEVTPPNYITSTTTYDFTPLLVDPTSDVTTNLTFHENFLFHHRKKSKSFESTVIKGFQINYKQSHQIENKYKTISVLNKDEWPTSEQLHLNPKQHEALMLALTNKVALIQGPPGTGKTFLGVRITEMLLHNRSVWCPSDQESTPILMICHTNHALDQFLELIVKRLKIRQGIIRVGSRCQNEIIQRFSLLNARQRARENRSIPNDIHHHKHKLLAEKITLESVLKEQQREMEWSRTNIVSLFTFTDYSIIDQRHCISLLEPCVDKTTTALLKWLGLHGGYEQISNDWIYEPHIKDAHNRREWNAEEADEVEEDEEEEQRRRNELDIEEEDVFLPSAIPKSETVTVNRNNIELLSQNKNSNKRKRTNVNEQLIRSIVENRTTLNEGTVQQINDNVWDLSMRDRYNLYQYWLFKYRQHLQNSISEKSQEYDEAVSSLADHRQEEDYHILKGSIIVAMTTTCAAKYHKLLQKLQNKIVIVEEAAAIFEAHIITALSTKCEHLILIGDHIQLRPNPSVYRLAVKYNIDVSLFERLIKNKFPNVRLNIQHRMRPEIARLMKHFYDDLDDHASVKNDRALVRGIASNIFFVDHNYMETCVDDGGSKRNEFEGKYIIELATYLIKQGYASEQITILVMYLGQRHFIAKQAKERKLLHGIRIMVTDNYQGEENDIIILSLVRSNTEKQIGFLTIHNRICVALSRARCGLFVIGNLSLLAEASDMWKKIVSSLSKTNNIGKGLPLSCRQHPEDSFIADKIQSFAQRPEGGCKRICNARLLCGHQCPLMCHNYDFEHEGVVCNRKCGEQLACGHSCKKLCHHKTPNQHAPCYIRVEKVIPECGHRIPIECCQTPTMTKCRKTTLKQLACGHSVDVPCRIIPSADELKRFLCPKSCDTILACKHRCTGKCGDCYTGQLHIACKEKCERELICSHVCRAPCATNCPPCLRDCEARCIHSRCRKKCGDICTPCKEPCNYKCKHLQCTRLCSEPCDRGPCNEPCDQKLICGHACIGICGEPCPRQCRICDKRSVQEIFFGSEDEPDARFVFLPDCRHIIEVTALDKFIENFLNNSNDKTAIRFPECPRCRQKIYCCARYMPILNRIDQLISQVKEKILGGHLKQETDNLRMKLIVDYEKMKRKLREITVDKSITQLFSLLKDEKQDLIYHDMLVFRTNVIIFLQEIDEILIDGRKKLQYNIFEELVNCPLRRVVRYLHTQQHYRNFAEQQLKDIQSELERARRVIYINTLIVSLQKTLTINEKEGVDSMQHLTTKSGPFTNQDRQKFDQLTKEFAYLNNLPGLGITDGERKGIVSALNMKKGHWYTCPNGHPYVITECGGANQESQCPDCGERIGGQNHRLVETNHHFRLMDESQHAAWSNEANLNIPPLLH